MREDAALAVLDALGDHELTARQVCDAIGESRAKWDDYRAYVRTYGRLRRLEQEGRVASRLSVLDEDGFERRLWRRADVALEDVEPAPRPTTEVWVVQRIEDEDSPLEGLFATFEGATASQPGVVSWSDDRGDGVWYGVEPGGAHFMVYREEVQP